MPARDYNPISAHGIIGNLRTAALVAADGGIDWLCLPNLDSASVFGALLDAGRGGVFRVRLCGEETGEQHYIEETNVLVTEFKGDAGTVSVVDLMPISGDIKGTGRSSAPPEIHRIISAGERGAEVEVEWRPRLGYARASMRIRREGCDWVAEGGGGRMWLLGLRDGLASEEGAGPVVRARISLAPHERSCLVTRWNVRGVASLESSLAALTDTARIWRDWTRQEGAVARREWAGEWFDITTRSALVFKLLMHADTGAIAAAATTSLPEEIGGVRNWDYRYAWIRDASMTAQALIALGHRREASDALHWMERVSAMKRNGEWELQVMYGHGESDLREQELPHLEGYRGSRPVRIGNDAASQLQLEVYAELMTTGYELARRNEKIEPAIRPFLSRVADHVMEVWREPDNGIWEIRGPRRHYTYSKIMCWVALDRAVLMAERFGLDGRTDRWRRERDIIKRAVLEHGYNRDVGAFTQSFDSSDLDATSLRIPMLEFLPCDDPRVQSTIDRTIEGLVENDLVHRYRNDDGLPGEEGAFGLCSFWLVDALAIGGRREEARRIFDAVLGHANHLGLFAEEFDPSTGEHLGNFPQAFTHIGLINSVLYLAYSGNRRVPETAPLGTSKHRRAANRAA